MIGKSKLKKHEELLRKISSKYGVQSRYIVALWGIETDFGRITGGFPVISSLATLAYDGRRSKFFRKELLLALKIVDGGHILAKDMMGSWAGAMGQNQFMPSSFLNFAVDYNGDGKKDIWNTLPDVFASSANYLNLSGWDRELTWGREVIVTREINEELISRSARKIDISKSLQEWSELGVLKADMNSLPNRDLQAYLIYPDGDDGRKYLVYENFKVIMRWNRSLFFGISVGTLADMIEYY